ncbi:threonine/serine exporter family protein [Flavobacterium sp. TSSA_36]|uniref:threonine/serine exporter family protein n=1 Tax=Flavobacterium sp. TSSA_36 TaxID=3447669 RepID=UPI003F39A3F7
MDIVFFLEKGIWLGCAALGFGMLFNVPKRALTSIFVIGALGGLMKFFMLEFEIGIVLAVLCGATLIGFLSVFAAHKRNCPPITFSIPAVIPMIPGLYAYKAMIGIIKLTSEKDPMVYSKMFFEALNNGLTALFVLIVLATGVAIPLLVSRKSTVKRIQIDEK